MVGTSFGPEVLQVLIDSEETAVYLAKKFGVPERLIRDKEQRKEIAALAQQAMQQQQQQGMPVE
jgi:glutathione S-transferase